MANLTNIQVKRIADFLKKSSAKVPQSAVSPKHGQWLDILATASGFRNWNAMSACVPEAPCISQETALWPSTHATYLGIARVLIAGELLPTHHIEWFTNHDSTKHEMALKMGKRLGEKLYPACTGLGFRYSQPDVKMPGGGIAAPWVNRAEGCPIVVTSKDKRITILLWWLRESYQLKENLPIWAQDEPAHYVHFSDAGDKVETDFESDEIEESLTDTFLANLTGKAQPKRSCIFVPNWGGSSEHPSPVLVEEGNPNAKPIDETFGTNWQEILAAVAARNAKYGLSTIDCGAIARRYEAVQRADTDTAEDYTEFSGIYDD